MNVLPNLQTEARLLQSLDRQLLKIADKLDEVFDPDDKESVKMLKLFRSMLIARRMWAKEYKLVQIPEQNQDTEKQEIVAEAKTNNGNSQKKTEFVANPTKYDVIMQSAQRQKENPPQKNGLLRR